MEVGFLLTISCVMTTIAMILFLGVIAFFVRFGGEGVKMLIDRFTGGDEQPTPAIQSERLQAQSAPARQSLRQRAQQLDFPAPQGQNDASFDAQAFGASTIGGNRYPDFPMPQTQQPQQPSLRPRGQFDAQSSAPANTSSFQPSTPSLSPSRPFQAGSQFNPRQPQPPQQGNQFGQPQQGNQLRQPPQQGNQFGQPQQGNQLRQPPQQGNQFGQPQQGNQLRQPPQQGKQFGQPQQGNPSGQPPQQGNQFGQPTQQQGGLGHNRPPLRSRPTVDGNTQYDRPIGNRDRRQGDDRDYIYDDRQGGDNFVDDVGDFIDNF
ncbi:MAG: hypothetical protein ACFE0Q_15100 [Anaerolineae bacterium]